MHLQTLNYNELLLFTVFYSSLFTLVHKNTTVNYLFMLAQGH